MSGTPALYGATAVAGPHGPSSSLSGGLLGAAIMVVIVIAVITAVQALARGRSGRRDRRSPGGYR